MFRHSMLLRSLASDGCSLWDTYRLGADNLIVVCDEITPPIAVPAPSLDVSHIKLSNPIRPQLAEKERSAIAQFLEFPQRAKPPTFF